ncbi:hypothetical protein [Crassaminicella indica]|uniref:Uncharacterized protein n=1 Tax=Crassaminicella indica TaxID=2855394 RepID=A0ABX8RFB9_9CLOT|nr:hypothetical protein [Crassaminicella indica]QXM07157.1 hypothetical protein KVH43_05500 [Crassaminicella indica]
MKTLKITIIIVILMTAIYNKDIHNVGIDNIKTTTEDFYGEWIVQKNITPKGIPSIYGKEDIVEMLGKKIVYSKEIASYADQICENPFYKKMIVKDDDLI